MAYTFTHLDQKATEMLAPLKSKIQDIVYPTRKYLGYRNSPLIILKDGKQIPLLNVLAKLRYGDDYDAALNEPIWADTNWYNASPDNINLLPLVNHKAKRCGRPSVYQVGVPVNHPDYHKRYMDLTRERQREYRRKRYVRVKNAAIEALDEQTYTPPAEAVLSPDPPDATTSEAEMMGSQLQNILTAFTPPPKTPPHAHPTFWKEVKDSPLPSSSFTKEFLDGLAAAPVSGREDK